MKLYHFTSTGHIGHILDAGELSKGTLFQGPDARTPANMLFLSSNPDPDRSGVDDGSSVMIPPHQRSPGGPDKLESVDKRRVRMTVTIPCHDRALKNYWTYAKGRVAQWYLDYEVARTTGGLASVRAWHVYRSIIPIERVQRFELMGEQDDYREVDIGTLMALERHEIAARYSDPVRAFEALLRGGRLS